MSPRADRQQEGGPHEAAPPPAGTPDDGSTFLTQAEVLKAGLDDASDRMALRRVAQRMRETARRRDGIAQALAGFDDSEEAAERTRKAARLGALAAMIDGALDEAVELGF